MKTIYYIIFTLGFIVTGYNLTAQPPRPPVNPSTQNEPVGENAPLGSGNALLLAMALAYAVYKASNPEGNGESEAS
jgi:hypothetical protein